MMRPIPQPCGCLVLTEKDDEGTHFTDEIEFCPLHLAAPRLLDALEDIRNRMWKAGIGNGSVSPRGTASEMLFNKLEALLSECRGKV